MNRKQRHEAARSKKRRKLLTKEEAQKIATANSKATKKISKQRAFCGNVQRNGIDDDIVYMMYY